MEKNELQNLIAKKVADYLQHGWVANFVPEDVNVTLQSENGFVDLGEAQEHEITDHTIVNAGGKAVTIQNGGAFFDSCTSFGIIRGGHVDLTVLGALEIDEKGNIANYMIPGKLVPGMGGAMDLVTGAKNVIVAMEHTNKGIHKILENCTLPLTGKGVVDMIITEMATMQITSDGIKVVDYNPKYTKQEIQDATGARLYFNDNL